MLSRVVKEHNQKQAAHKDVQERRKREAAIEASKLTYRLMETLNSGVEKAYINQRKLETEAKQLQAHVAQFSKQTVLWLKMVESFNQSLKTLRRPVDFAAANSKDEELGDVENWSRVIEADMTSIASALEYAYKGDGPQSTQTAS